LMELAASTNRIPGVACRFTCDPPVCIQDVTTATHLYRIAQEAVNNALKHGRAGTVDIALTDQAAALELSVTNDGRAIPPANQTNRGMGLNVMRYRAEVIGASLSIESGKRKGVRVACTLRRKT
jgi:signal transduction histidine kinase